MRNIILFVCVSFILSGLLFADDVQVVTINGSINPASMQYVVDGIDRAEKSGDILIIQLDTPGGLLSSTREMVKKMLPAEIPIIVYVYPSGSRAGSAGVFITLAGHIAVMAPGTNIGAAHPVSMGGEVDSTMNKKITNDAVAFVRSIAEQRGRNPEWAEAAVRESASITDQDAIEKGIIDFIAKDVRDILEQIDGDTVKLADSEHIFSTENAEITYYDMNWREELLNKISDPNIAYILMMLGFYGLLFELYNPGAIFPGVLGGICLILAFFAMQALPVNWAGILLIILALILFLLEIKIVSHGVLSIGGGVALILGSVMLFKGGADLPSLAVKVSWSVIMTIVLVTILFFMVVITFGIRAQKRKPDYGREALMDKPATVMETLDPEGMVRVEGELWTAYSDEKHEKGEVLKVIGIEGMKLKVG